MRPVHEYAFDVKLCAAIRIRANSQAEALATLHDCVDTMDCNGGMWPNGAPILFEASIDDCSPLCFEIDGEPV